MLDSARGIQAPSGRDSRRRLRPQLLRRGLELPQERVDARGIRLNTQRRVSVLPGRSFHDSARHNHGIIPFGVCRSNKVSLGYKFTVLYSCTHGAFGGLILIGCRVHRCPIPPHFVRLVAMAYARRETGKDSTGQG